MLEARNMRLSLYFVAPALVFMLAIFLYPIVIVIAQSVHTLDGEFTWAGYLELFKSKLFSKVLATTFEISFLATLVTVFLAYPIAYHLAKAPPRVPPGARAFAVLDLDPGEELRLHRRARHGWPRQSGDPGGVRRRAGHKVAV